MIKLNKSINTLFQKSSNTNMFLFGFLDYNWKKIVGEKISKKTELVKIEKTTLFIKCKNPTWKTELQYQKKELLEKISETTNKITNIIII